MGVEDKIREIEEELRKTPYNKATQYHIGRLKARLSRLRDEAVRRSSKKSQHNGYSVKKLSLIHI